MDFTELQRQLLVQHLRRHIAGEVRFDDVSCRLYSTDASIYQIRPLGVVIPRTAEDIQTTVQVCAETRIPITARGGGTSLSGQSIGPGVILDCSKYLNGILEIDPAMRIARIQPGVILDQLNHAVAAHGLQFGPDVATASRANLGGMIGNNSAGAHSIVYGKTIDHVRRLRVVLGNGQTGDLGPLSLREWGRKMEMQSFEGTLYRTLRQVVQTHAAEIARRFPRILRRVSGYNLDVFCEAFEKGGGPPTPSLGGDGGDGAAAGGPTPRAAERPRPVGLHQLVVGSEGTLAVVAEAELNLVPRPKTSALLVPHFASLAAAMDAVAPCLELQPSAIELMDQMLLDLARENLSLKDTMALIEGRPAAVFMVEFSGDDSRQVRRRIERLERRLGGVAGVTGMVRALEPALRQPLWSLRSAAMPLLLGMHGDRKPVTFVEDTAVSPEKLPEFVERFREILRRHGTHGCFYGHASVGCLHIRPLLNLKDVRDVAAMRQIADDVSDLVLQFGGALSGEHGDGLARSEWNRKMFGDAVYDGFRQIKRAFDPHHILNPGKVVDAPAMTENLRYGPNYHPQEPATRFDYGKQEGFVRSIELCNGSGVCRKLEGGTMCPSFRATRAEKDSTRGRANALRLALAGEQPLKELRSAGVHDVLDLCLMCKACKSECPSNVDLAKLKAEFLNFYYHDRVRPPGHWLLAHVHRLYPRAAKWAPLVNVMQGLRPVRWAMEMFAGIDRRRSLPPVYWRHFRRWFARRKPGVTGQESGVRSRESGVGGQESGMRGQVILLDDCFTTFNEPHIGQAAVRVIEAAGYGIELAGLTCCARPLISKGFLTEARDLIAAQAPALASRLTGGAPLLGIEPSCLLTLADDWPELLPGNDTRRVAAACDLTDVWLGSQVQANRCHLALKPRAQSCVIHGHCHQKALRGLAGAVTALRLIPDLIVSPLDTGCCGMAGSFGFEKEHYDISVAIARLELLPALEANADSLVIAPGTSCRHQIKDLAGRKALHPLELLAEELP